jgi:hypothetical protein
MSPQGVVGSRSNAAPLVCTPSASTGPNGCRRFSRGSRPGYDVHEEGVDEGNISDEDSLWQGHKDVAPSLGANGEAVSISACTCSEAGESVKGWLKGGGDARPVHSTAQNPFQDVMAQRKLYSEGRASHALVVVRAM